MNLPRNKSLVKLTEDSLRDIKGSKSAPFGRLLRLQKQIKVFPTASRILEKKKKRWKKWQGKKIVGPQNRKRPQKSIQNYGKRILQIRFGTVTSTLSLRITLLSAFLSNTLSPELLLGSVLKKIYIGTYKNTKGKKVQKKAPKL